LPYFSLVPPSLSFDTTARGGVLPDVLKTAGFFAAAGVFVLALAFEYAVKAVTTVQVLQMVLEAVVFSDAVGHFTASLLFLGKRKSPGRS
jgi:hypothetical protein